MSTLKPEHVRTSLLVGNFGRNTDLPPPGDPIAILPMVVEIDRLKCYDGNVRLVPNPKFEELLLAIQTQGPEAAGVLPITRRPNDELYMIARGGNTRLQIIQKLWKATQDARFRTVQCLFHPWPGEAKVLADHIAENENRGEMIFIEKALALRMLKQKMEQETGEPISLREFVRRLCDAEFKMGLKVSLTQMHRLQYASDFLYPLLPETLKAGLGPRQVEQIQKLESLFADYWKRRGSEQGDEEAFRTLFADVLSHHDGPGFFLDAVRHALEIRLTEILEQSLHTVQAGIAALESGLEIGPAGEDLDLAAIARGSPAVSRWPERPAAATSPSTRGQGPAALPDSSSPSRPGTAKTARPPVHHPEAEREMPAAAEAALTVSDLRTAACALAQRLAKRHGFGACIEASACGLGFWVTLPAQPIATQAVTAAMWWMLVGLSEQLAYLPNDGINHVAFMPAHNELKELVSANRWDEIYSRVGRGSSWLVLPHQLRTSEADIEDLVLLFRTIRSLRAAEADLWHDTRETT